MALVAFGLLLTSAICTNAYTLDPTVSKGHRPSVTRRGWFASTTLGLVASLAPESTPAIGDVDRWQADPTLGKMCVKRDFLGKCAEYATGDVDMGEESGTDVVSEKQRETLAAIEADDAGNAYIMSLRQKTQENAKKNKDEVDMKSFENSQAGEFGPFSRYLPVRKLDGTYEIMTYSTYKQKEDLGEVKNKKYLIDIDALVAEKNPSKEAPPQTHQRSAPQDAPAQAPAPPPSDTDPATEPASAAP